MGKIEDLKQKIGQAVDELGRCEYQQRVFKARADQLALQVNQMDQEISKLQEGAAEITKAVDLKDVSRPTDTPPSTAA